MKRFGRWLLRLLRSALLLTLVLALMPWVSELVKNLFPEPLNARTVSEILSHEMRMSRRLETCRVEDDGVLVSTVDAFLIGTVQTVKIHYAYQASIGINLENIQIQYDEHQISITLPEIELLSDSLSPDEVDVKDFWYPLTENRRRHLLTEETEKRRTYYFSPEEDGYRQAREKTLESIHAMIDEILEGIQTVPITVEFADVKLQSLGTESGFNRLKSV